MSQFNGSARLKMAQLGWLSHFEPSRGITSEKYIETFHNSTVLVFSHQEKPESLIGDNYRKYC